MRQCDIQVVLPRRSFNHFLLQRDRLVHTIQSIEASDSMSTPLQQRIGLFRIAFKNRLGRVQYFQSFVVISNAVRLDDQLQSQKRFLSIRLANQTLQCGLTTLKCFLIASSRDQQMSPNRIQAWLSNRNRLQFFQRL